MILRLRFITMLTDYVFLVAAFVLAYFARVGFIFSTDFPFKPYFVASLITAAFWLVSLLVFRGYNPNVRFTRWIHLLKVLIAGVTGTALFGLIYYFGQKALFSRLLLAYIFLFGTSAMILIHLSFQWMERWFIGKGYGNIRVLLIGSNRGAKRFLRSLQERRSIYVPVAILDGYGTSEKEIYGVPVLGKLNILEEVVEEQNIEAIVQGDNIEQVINIHSFCQKNNIAYYLLPYLFGAYQGELQISWLEQPVISPESPKSRSLWEKILS